MTYKVRRDRKREQPLDAPGCILLAIFVGAILLLIALLIVDGAHDVAREMIL